jgi:thiol-disulfide isomerase/thioredoxin
MKEVKMFMFDGCPHCRRAKEMIAEIFAENPEYAKVPFTVIDENKNPEIANKYDYYYVPTFYSGDVKMMEGVPTKEAIEKVFAKALK